MNRIIYILTTLFFCGISQAQNYDDLIRRERLAVEAYSDDYQNCLNNKSTSADYFIELDRCMQVIHLRYSSETNIPAIRASMMVLNLYWKQLENLDKDAKDRKISIYEWESKHQKMIQQIKKEEEEGVKKGIADLKSIGVREAAISANQRINSAIRAFGGTIQNSTSDKTTYLLNGRIINCFTTQNIVNCN